MLKQQQLKIKYHAQYLQKIRKVSFFHIFSYSYVTGNFFKTKKVIKVLYIGQCKFCFYSCKEISFNYPFKYHRHITYFHKKTLYSYNIIKCVIRILINNHNFDKRLNVLPFWILFFLSECIVDRFLFQQLMQIQIKKSLLIFYY